MLLFIKPMRDIQVCICSLKSMRCLLGKVEAMFGWGADPGNGKIWEGDKDIHPRIDLTVEEEM